MRNVLFRESEKEMKKLVYTILIGWVLISNNGCTTGKQDDFPDSTAISISLPPARIYTSQDDAIGNLVWSPNGDEIAFTAIQPLESDDVYVLNIQTGEVRFQANDSVVLSWTLDGRILVESSGVLEIIRTLGTSRGGLQPQSAVSAPLGADMGWG